MNFFKKILFIVLIFILLFVLFIVYELFTANKKYSISEYSLQIPIYTYHDIVLNSSEIEVDYMQTTLDNFKKQILGLKKIGYTPITYKELSDYKNEGLSIPKRSCIITFDDGYNSIYKYVYPIIKENNIPITIFVIDSCIGSENYLNWEQLKEMHDSGLVSVYSHGLNHIEYNNETPTRLLNETEKAYEHLRQNLNDSNILKVFAYPYGLYTNESVQILADNGYIQNLMDGKINKSKNLDLSMLHRVYPLNDSVLKILLKQAYKTIRY